MSELSAVPNIHEVWDNASTAEVCLHPLTLVNITDHYSRRNFGNTGPAKRVVGMLLGEQSDKKIEIFTSYEAVFTDDDGRASHSAINIDFVRNQKEQFAKVYKTYDVIGWYITGFSLSADDIAITNNAVRENFCEAPLILVVDTNPPSYVQTLPVSVFETIAKVEKDKVTTTVRKIRYTVQSEESERIGIDTAMQVDFLSEENPTLVPTAQRLHNAVSMLQQRINVVLAYLQEVKAGTIAPDFELLRKISSLCNQLPCADSPAFEASISRQYEDALLVVYMSLVTKGSAFLSRLVEKSSVFAERRRPGISMLGPM